MRKVNLLVCKEGISVIHSKQYKKKLTIVNLKVSRTGCGLAASSSHSAGVLARILGLASGHAQAEGVTLAGHLHAVGGTVVKRLVVSVENKISLLILKLSPKVKQLKRKNSYQQCNIGNKKDELT